MGFYAHVRRPPSVLLAWNRQRLSSLLETGLPARDIRARTAQLRLDLAVGLPSGEHQDQPRPAGAWVITPRMEARVLAMTRKPPPDGSTHWSSRKMARELGISHVTVAKIWARAGLKPHRLSRYMASNDPDFEHKAADIIGLYLDPPKHAAVFCLDEKSHIQALDRLDPVLPLSPGRIRFAPSSRQTRGCDSTSRPPTRPG